MAVMVRVAPAINGVLIAAQRGFRKSQAQRGGGIPFSLLADNYLELGIAFPLSSCIVARMEDDHRDRSTGHVSPMPAMDSGHREEWTEDFQLEPHSDDLPEGWTLEELRHAWQKGIGSGVTKRFEVERFKEEARRRIAT
jgi:hypothetical protein